MCSLYRMVVFPAASSPSMTTCARRQLTQLPGTAGARSQLWTLSYPHLSGAPHPAAIHTSGNVCSLLLASERVLPVQHLAHSIPHFCLLQAVPGQHCLADRPQTPRLSELKAAPAEPKSGVAVSAGFYHALSNAARALMTLEELLPCRYSLPTGPFSSCLQRALWITAPACTSLTAVPAQQRACQASGVPLSLLGRRRASDSAAAACVQGAGWPFHGPCAQTAARSSAGGGCASFSG